jgi:hypothetical protein
MRSAAATHAYREPRIASHTVAPSASIAPATQRNGEMLYRDRRPEPGSVT